MTEENATPPEGEVSAPAETTPIEASTAQVQETWYSSFQDPELRGVAEARHWESPEDSVRSYRELEKLRGVPADQLLKLPSDVSSLDDIAPVFERLGTPATSSDYQVDLGEDTTVFQEMLHKAKATPAQAKVLAQEYQARMEAENQKAVEEFDRQSQADVNELKSQWGSTFQSREADVNRAISNLNLTSEEVSSLQISLGTKRMWEALQQVGAQFAEAPGPGNTAGEGGSFGMSPDAARAEITRLKADKEFMGDYLKGKEKPKQMMDNLYRLAYPS